MTNAPATLLEPDLLPFGWHELHADDGDQQVIVGPGGVFLFSTRRHPAVTVKVFHQGVFVPGRRTDDLRHEQLTAERVSNLLSLTCGFPVECEPVVLIASGELSVQSRPDDVHVLPIDVRDRWLQHMPRRLTDESVERIAHHAQAHAAWRAAVSN